MLDNDNDIAAVIAALPPELRPETPVLRRQEAYKAAIDSGREAFRDHSVTTYIAAFKHAHNYGTAMTEWALTVASAYVALTATPPSVASPEVRLSPLAGCRAWILDRLGRGSVGPYPLHLAARVAGLSDSEFWAALGMLRREDAISLVDDADGLRCRLNTSVVRDGDADLEVAAGNFRMVGSPFADRRADIPRTVPVPVAATFAVYRPDMTTGTFPNENRAGDTLDEMLASPASSPTPDRVRAVLAWEDADGDDDTLAESVLLDLASMKDAIANHRDASNAIG